MPDRRRNAAVLMETQLYTVANMFLSSDISKTADENVGQKSILNFTMKRDIYHSSSNITFVTRRFVHPMSVRSCNYFLGHV